MYPYSSFTHLLMIILLWWVILFVFQRLSNRYPEPNPIKKDLIITLVQSTLFVILFPIIFNFFR